MICPLCNNRAKQVLTQELRKNEKQNVHYCEHCDLGFLAEERTEEELKTYYQRQYRKEYKPNLDQEVNLEGLFRGYVDFQQERIRFLKPYCDKTKKLLEVGCSAGMFLFHAKKYVGEVVGIDYDSRSAHFASQKCSCPVFDADIEETGLREQSFDIICMFQLLEHIKNPCEFLKKYSKYLKPKGILCLEVPNLYDSLVYAYNLPHHHKFYFHRAHRLYFTAKSLASLMRKANCKGEIYFTQDYNILNHMHWISVDAPQSDCVPGLSLPSLPLRDNLGSDKKDELNSFIKRMDYEYKEILKKLGITSNLFFIGTRA